MTDLTDLPQPEIDWSLKHAVRITTEGEVQFTQEERLSLSMIDDGVGGVPFPMPMPEVGVVMWFSAADGAIEPNLLASGVATGHLGEEITITGPVVFTGPMIDDDTNEDVAEGLSTQTFESFSVIGTAANKLLEARRSS